MSKAVVISAGSVENYDYIASFIPKDAFVICADGGMRHCKSMGIVPDLTVGDFDSWKGEVTGEVLKFKPEKDYTDTHLAVTEALRRGYNDITLLGCSGTRLDHTISNVGILEFVAKQGGKAWLINETNKITVITDKGEFEGVGYISVIPVGKAEGVCIENLKYTLHNAALTFDQSLAVSNEFIGKKAEISVKNGSLIIIMSKD